MCKRGGWNYQPPLLLHLLNISIKTQQKTAGATGGFGFCELHVAVSKDCRRRLFLRLMSIHSELFLSLMRSNLMLLSFSSTRHCRAPYQPVELLAMPIPEDFCNYRTIMQRCLGNVKYYSSSIQNNKICFQ